MSATAGGSGSHQESRRPSSSPRSWAVALLLTVLAAGLLVWRSIVPSPAGLPDPVRALVSDPDLARIQARSGARDWTLYGGDYANRRWSSLSQIDRGNVTRLVPRLVIATGAGKTGSLETTPLVADGVIFFTSPVGDVVAWDLRRNRQAWRYHHSAASPLYCCGPSNRGVALGHGHVYVGTLDAMLLALDAGTGALAWQTMVDSGGAGYSLTMAPQVVDSLVIIGTSGGEFGIRGHVSAYRARDGALVWRRYTIPSPEEGGWWGNWSATTVSGESLGRDLSRERADSARYPESWRHGGGSVWGTPAYDPASDLLFVGVGNPAPPFDASGRPGDNLYTNSLLALRASTGEIVWFKQYLPHDTWDMDAASPPLLVPGSQGLAVAHALKLGRLYLMDAADGRLLRRSEPFVPQSNLFASLHDSAIVVAPGAGGGVTWSPAAWSPETGLVYVVAVHRPMRFNPKAEPFRPGTPWLGGAPRPIRGEAKSGTISAIDPGSGRIVWQVRTDRPMVGGVLATAGGLVFTGEGTGWFRAYDAATGLRLWQHRCDAGVNAPPIAFQLDGEEMIAVAAGGNTQQGFRLGDRLYIFALPPRR